MLPTSIYGLAKSRLGVCVAAVALLAGIASTAVAEGHQAPEQDVKAALVYKLTKFVTWPEDVLDGAQAQLRVCVVGADDVGDALESVSKQQPGRRKLDVERIPRRQTRWPECHVLYVGESEQARLRRHLQRVRGKSVLTVSDIPEFAEQGGAVNIARSGSRLQIVINIDVAKSADLRFDSRLLELARIVHESE